MNEWDGITHDYQNKKDLIHKEIFLPKHAKKNLKTGRSCGIVNYMKAINAQYQKFYY